MLDLLHGWAREHLGRRERAGVLRRGCFFDRPIRHYFSGSSTSAVTSLRLGVDAATAARATITGIGLSTAILVGVRRASLAVPMAAVAPGADSHQLPAPTAEVETVAIVAEVQPLAHGARRRTRDG